MQLILTIAADHPAFEGHFPDRPVLPAVVLLDAVLHAATRAGAAHGQPWHIATAKFLRPVGGGANLQITCTPRSGGLLEFRITSGDGLVALGTLASSALPLGPADAAST